MAISTMVVIVVMINLLDFRVITPLQYHHPRGGSTGLIPLVQLCYHGVPMFHEFTSYLSLPRASEAWIIKDVLPVGGSLNIYGAPKCGKSIASLQMASAIATEGIGDWLGFPVRSHGPVAYLQVDTPRSIWALDLDNLVREGCRFDNVYFADRETAPYPFDILGDGGRALYDHLRAFPTPPLAIFIDTLREIHDNEENDASAMKTVVAALQVACAPSAMVLISHSRKDQPFSGDDLMGDQRGSSYLPGRMDGVLKLTKKSLIFQSRTHPESRVGIRSDPDRHGMITLADQFLSDAISIRRSDPSASVLALARELQSVHPSRSLEACRSAIRRAE